MQPKYPMINKCIRRCGTYIQQNISHPKKENEIMSFAAKWMSLEIIILSGNKSEQDKYYTSLTCEIKKNYTDEVVYKTETDSQTQKTKLMVTRGKGGGDKSGVWN